MAELVIVESPFAGDIEKNLRYVRACMRDAILRGEAPFASHALYTQEGVLRDEVPEERELGMGLGWHVMKRADKSVFYTDLGWSSGMVRGYNAAAVAGVEREIRRLNGDWSQNDPGVDYAACVGRGEFIPPDAVNMRIIDAARQTEQSLCFIEVDLKQGYAVEAGMKDGIFTITVIKEHGRFRFGTYKD